MAEAAGADPEHAPRLTFPDGSPTRANDAGLTMNTVEFIRRAQEDWFDRIRPYLLDSNLNVGSGHGFFSQAARRAGIRMTSLDVAVADGLVDPAELVLYDGARMPFADGAFDVSLAMYVLHHTPDPAAVLAEMKRVTRRRIILVEELYRRLPGKLRLALLDYSINATGGLKSKIRWSSYLTPARLAALAGGNGWQVVHKEARPRLGFDEVLWIVDAETRTEARTPAPPGQ